MVVVAFLVSGCAKCLPPCLATVLPLSLQVIRHNLRCVHVVVRASRRFRRRQVVLCHSLKFGGRLKGARPAERPNPTARTRATMSAVQWYGVGCRHRRMDTHDPRTLRRDTIPEVPTTSTLDFRSDDGSVCLRWILGRRRRRATAGRTPLLRGGAARLRVPSACAELRGRDTRQRCLQSRRRHGTRYVRRAFSELASVSSCPCCEVHVQVLFHA